MSGVNKVILIGNVGQDPESRALASGESVVNLRLATSEKWTDKATGEKKERTEWHSVVLFRKLAELAAQYVTKGSTIYIEGKIQTRKWVGKDGNDRYSTEIVADNMTFLSLKKDGGGEQPAPSQQRAKTAEAKAAPAKPAPNLEEDGFDDDLPF